MHLIDYATEISEKLENSPLKDWFKLFQKTNKKESKTNNDQVLLQQHDHFISMQVLTIEGWLEMKMLLRIPSNPHLPYQRSTMIVQIGDKKLFTKIWSCKDPENLFIEGKYYGTRLYGIEVFDIKQVKMLYRSKIKIPLVSKMP